MDIREIVFDSFPALEFVTQQARLVVVTSMGPRIAYWGRPDGENLLYWQNNGIGREDWRLLGGHRVWMTRPLADEAEDAYASDNDPCSVDIFSDGARITGQAHPFLKVQRGIEIRMLDDESFSVISFLTNVGPMLYSCGVWAPTCINPTGGKQFGILLGDRSQRCDLIRMVIPRAFAGHTAQVNDPQIEFTEDFIILRPTGIETKRMLYAPHGAIAMTWPGHGLTFIKSSAYNPLASYPLGCNLAFYAAPDNWVVEMESYGPEQTVLPGQTIENRETWHLISREMDWHDPTEFLALI